MATLGSLIRNVWMQRGIFSLVGAAAGFAYYYYVGCEGGCPLTGNPWISTAYGAFVGFLLHPGRAKGPVTPNQERSNEKGH